LKYLQLYWSKQMEQVKGLRKMAAQQPIRRNTEVVAIGDVHGCASLLRQAIWPHLGSGAELILLGDLIDRSPEPNGDRLVLELVRELQSNPEAYGLAGVTVLRGNHEQMLLDALAEEENGEATDLWTWNGGNTEFLPVARDHQAWLEALPLTAIRGSYLFVHAGVRPTVPDPPPRPALHGGAWSLDHERSPDRSPAGSHQSRHRGIQKWCAVERGGATRPGSHDLWRTQGGLNHGIGIHPVVRPAPLCRLRQGDTRAFL
jgi:hypothetical protein